MQALQILIDGFAISSLYAIGAIGFTLMFGVSGVLNLSHGAIMVVSAVAAWAVAGAFPVGAFGVAQHFLPEGAAVEQAGQGVGAGLAHHLPLNGLMLQRHAHDLA